MEGQYNLRSPAVKRLMREAKELREPNEQFFAQPLEDNLFEWHFTVRGPADSEFESGVYHGRIILPSEYPMKPPSIILLTPNGRFETNKKICLSISGHHPESWQPSWSLRTALLAIIGFMPTHGNGAIGSLDYSAEERKRLAKRSQKYECPQCGNVCNLLRPVTEASRSLTQEARELGAQINLQGEQEKTPTSAAVESSGTENTSASTAAAVPQPTTNTQSAAASQPTVASATITSSATMNTQPAVDAAAVMAQQAAMYSAALSSFYPGSAAADSSMAAAAAAAAAAASAQMMSGMGSPMMAGVGSTMMGGMGSPMMGSQAGFTPMFWMQASNNPYQPTIPIQNPHTTIPCSPQYNFSPIPPIPSQSFFMNPSASTAMALGLSGVPPQMPGTVPTQNIVHNVIPVNEANLAEVLPLANQLVPEVNGEVLCNGESGTELIVNGLSSEQDGVNDTTDKSDDTLNLVADTIRSTTPIPSQLIASVPTVVSGVPTVISGVQTVVPGIHPMVPGIPAQSVLVGVSSLHDGTLPVSSGSCNDSVVTSSAAPAAVFHWVYYAPTMMAMAVAPDCRRSSVYARPRMQTSTNTSQSDESSRPHLCSGSFSSNKPGEEGKDGGGKTKESEGEKRENKSGENKSGENKSGENEGERVDNVKQSKALNSKTTVNLNSTLDSDKNTQAKTSQASPSSTTAALSSNAAAQSLSAAAESSIRAAESAGAAAESASAAAESASAAAESASAAAQSSSLAAESSSTESVTAGSSLTANAGGTELRRRGPGAGIGVRRVNQSAELPPDVPRVGGGPVSNFILNVIVVVLIGCILALWSRRLLQLG